MRTTTIRVFGIYLAILFFGAALGACSSAPGKLSKSSDVNEDVVGVEVKAGEGQPPFDEDGDGVIDRNDACPYTPKGGKANAFGCIDSDNDGVPDLLDTCADTAAKVRVDKWGCPHKPS